MGTLALLRTNSTVHPMSISKSAPQLKRKPTRPQLNEKVQVQFGSNAGTSLSPATIMDYDPDDGTYVVRLSLTDGIARVLPAQINRLNITAAQERLPQLRPRGLIKPQRHQLEFYQLEIKAICFMRDRELARAWSKWAHLKELLRIVQERVAARQKVKDDAVAAEKAKRRATVFGAHGGVLNKLKSSLSKEHALTKEEREAKRLAALPEAKRVHHQLKTELNEAWRSGEFDEAKELLDKCIQLNGKSDALYGFRARVLDRSGKMHEALDDARRAVSIWNRPDNHLLLCRLLQSERRLDEAGSHYHAALKRGGTGMVATRDDRIKGLASNIRGHRDFYNGRGQKAAKVIEEGSGLVDDRPDPPDLKVSGGEAAKLSDAASLVVRWTPVDSADSSSHTSINEYTIQHCEQVTVFEPKQRKFEVADGPWQTTVFKLRALQQTRLLTGKHVAEAMASAGSVAGPLEADRRGMLVARLEPLRWGTDFKLRIKCSTSDGESVWGPEVMTRTDAIEDAGSGLKIVPSSWLLGAASCVGVASEEAARTGEGAEGFLHSVVEVLNDRVMLLRRAFGYYKTGQHVTHLQFVRMLRDVGLMQGCKPGQAAKSGAKLMPTNDVDLRFQRLVRSVTLDDGPPATAGATSQSGTRPGTRMQDVVGRAKAANPRSSSPTPGSTATTRPASTATNPTAPNTRPGSVARPGSTAAAGEEDEGAPTRAAPKLVDWKKLASQAKSFSAAELREAATAYHAKMVEEAGEDGEVIIDPIEEGDAALGLMAPFQWIAALIEISWHCFPGLVGIESRLARCADVVLDYVLPLVDSVKQKRAALNSTNVRALFSFFDKDLRSIFRAYAAADQGASVGDASTLESLNLAELSFMMKEGKMLDENLTMVKLKSVFAEANAGAEEEGIDEDESEMSYEEFLPALALICDAKIPEPKRGGEAFEYTLHAWLQLQFVPTYRRLLKDKERGLSKKTL